VVDLVLVLVLDLVLDLDLVLVLDPQGQVQVLQGQRTNPLLSCFWTSWIWIWIWFAFSYNALNVYIVMIQNIHNIFNYCKCYKFIKLQLEYSQFNALKQFKGNETSRNLGQNVRQQLAR